MSRRRAWRHWSPKGSRYEHWWKDALEVAAYVRDNFAALSRQTRLFHETLYQTNLPYWMRDRISSPLAVLKSKTVFWSKDGYFGGWEGQAGARGCCAGSCTHVWHYAQAYAYLYPELGRKMREIELALQRENGALPHRMKVNTGPAADGMCGSILSIYRGHLLSTDDKWLAKVWPATRKAMEFFIRTWDGDKDGVLAGAQWNTLDCACGGSSSWLGSMYLAALAACEKMAGLMGEDETAQAYRKIRISGQKKQDETLFNGEYYFQIPDPQPLRDYGPGCHIDQALGVWWANQLNLGWVYPRQRVRKAMESLLRYNFHSDFTGRPQRPRKFVADGDAGMQMITWPRGGRPPANHTMRYADEVMSGFEYAAAATMIQCGLLREGFAVVKAAHDRYDGRLRTGLRPGPGTSGNPFGDDECGRFYARTMSSWSLLLACQGFVCDSPGGVIGFKPIWQPEDHKSFFSAAECWGLFTQRRSKEGLSVKIEVCYGRLRFRQIHLAATEDTRRSKGRIVVAGKTVDALASPKDWGVILTFADEGEELIVEAGSAIEITLYSRGNGPGKVKP
ncbi:MAG: GH116 family glycosyl hydrolase [Planctomycetota bacterium]